jgi:thiamine biosynthesis lipoprotein
MRTHLGIEVYGDDQETCDRAVQAARDEIDRLDRMMTDWKPESPLMDINHAAGFRPEKTPPDLFFLIRKSLQLSELTDGAFDITFAGAGKLWRWRDPDPVVPDAAAVRAALEHVGWKKVVLTNRRRRCSFPTRA